MQETLAMRNGPNIKVTLNLLINSNVRIQREKDKQTRLFKLFVINEKTYIIRISRGLTNFQSIIIKSYYINKDI